MFKGLSNIASMMKQAQQMQGKMAEMQDSLGDVHVEGTSGGGMVTVEADGKQQIRSCKISDSLFETGDKEMIEELVAAAANQALEKAKEAAAQEMSKLTEGMNIPGMEDALSKFGFGGQTDSSS